jgi:anti-sigma factor RsiW
MSDFSDAELVAFLDEALPADRCSELEQQLRDTAGLHTIGAIWRRSQISCASRSELGQYVLGTLPNDHARYIDFHLTQIGCRYCRANLEDLQAASESTNSRADENATRRKRYFQTSAGYLKDSDRS